VLSSSVDSDGDLVILFQMHHGKVVSKNRISDLYIIGEGPVEVRNASTLFMEQDQVVIADRFGKLTFLAKEGGKYKVIKTEYLAGAKYGKTSSPRTVVKFNGKYYWGCWTYPNPEKFLSEGYFISVFNPMRKSRKDIVKRSYSEEFRGLLNVFPYIKVFQNKILVILDTELKLNIIDPVKDVIIREVKLEPPSFYKEVEDLWKYIPGRFSPTKFHEWRLSYNRIVNVLSVDNSLILQVRSRQKEKPKFALLFYDLADYRLQKTLYTEHLLLSEKNGNLYFLENGDPGKDDDAENLNILLYRKQK